MKAIFDGAVSLIAAVLTLAICGAPVWLSHLAIQGGIAPLWAYVPVAALAAVGLIMVFSFMRKAMRGISPSRDRRR